MVEQGFSLVRMEASRIAGEIIAKDGKLGIRMIYYREDSFGFWEKAVVCMKCNSLPNWEEDCFRLRDILHMKRSLI